MIIEHWTFCILHSVSPVPPRRPDARREDREQFLTLLHHEPHRPFRTQLHLGDELEPGACLSQFLDANPELVDEVATGLGALNLTVVCEGRRAAPHELERRLLADRRRRQVTGEAADCGSEPDQPILEIVARGGHLPPNSGRAADIRVTEVTRVGTLARETIPGEAGASSYCKYPMSNTQLSISKLGIRHWTFYISLIAPAGFL